MGEGLAGSARPMWQNPPTPPNPVADALREHAAAVRDLAAAIREATNERGQYRQLIPEDTTALDAEFDAELDADLEARS